MRALIQRVNYAYLECQDYQTSINNGFIVFLGIKDDDNLEDYNFIQKIKVLEFFR